MRLQVIQNITREILEPMNAYRDWAFSSPIQSEIASMLKHHEARLSQGDGVCSVETLAGIDHHRHDGAPDEFVGINMNSDILKLHVGQLQRWFIEEARAKSDELDRQLQHQLGAKVCALKMFYPAGGYIPWHTNWDAAGYNIIFTYSAGGSGYWRHVDPAGASSVVPRSDRLVHIGDKPGWNAKAGYFGRKDELDKITWHCAYAREPRLTLSYLIYEKDLWENLVEELNEG
jgi:hypothetical protein